MPQFIVTRVEDDYEGKPVAALNIYRDGDKIQIEVRSKSRVLRDHLRDVLASPFYQVSPMNYLAAGISANYSLYIEPNTKLFIMYMSDRLGWYGYIMRPINKESVLKSIYDLHYDFFAVIDVLPNTTSRVVKAMGGGGCGSGGDMYYNKKGELVVMRVPAGCMAVNNDGRVVGPGKYLHARVNTPDSAWSLIEVPKEYSKKIETFEKAATQAKGNENHPFLKRLIERNKKLLQEVREGKREYTPALHLITNLAQREEVNENPSELEGENTPPEKIYTEYVQIPKEELEEFKEQLDSVVQNATKLDTSPKEMADGVEAPLFNPELGSAGITNVSDAVYYNPELGIITTARHMRDVLRASKRGTWKYALPNQYYDIVNNEEAIEREAKRVLAAKEKMSPWLAAQYHFLLNSKSNEVGKVKFDQFVKEYNLDTEKLKDLKIDKEFLGRINALVGVRGVSNSAYAPLDYSVKMIGKLEELKKDPNERLLEKEVDGFVENELSKVMEVSDEGILHFKKDVFEIKDTPKTFKDLAGRAKKETWNELAFRLNRPKLGNYQAVLAKIISYPKLYSWTGGLKQGKGFDLNLEQGTGKTVIMLAAEAAMRTKEEFKNHFKAKVLSNGRWRTMERFTVIVAPNPHNWRDTIKGARKEEVHYIAGNKVDRQNQWEKLFRDIEDGKKIPRYIVIGTGKFRSDTEKEKINEEEEAKLRIDSMDVGYLKMLTTGFKSKKTEKEIAKEGLIANFILDEAGLFVNKSSQRTQIMRQIRALVTSDRNKGLFFTLNGEILSNSLSDAVYRLAYVNDKAFNGEDAILGTYGKETPKGSGRYLLIGLEEVHNLKKIAAQQKNKYWQDQVQKAIERARNYVEQFKKEFPNSFRLSMKMISGKDLKSTETVTTGLHGTFANIYMQAFNKFAAIKQLEKAARDDATVKEIVKSYALGSFATVLQTAFGVANPRTMFDYAIGDDILWKEIDRAIKKKTGYSVDKTKKEEYLSEMERIRGEIDAYLAEATTSPFDTASETLAKFAHIFKRIPKSSKQSVYDEEMGKEKSFTTSYRERLWKRHVSEETRELLKNIINSKPDPVSTEIVSKAQVLLDKQADADNEPPRLVIGSGSRQLAEKVAALLEKQYKKSGDVIVQVITGDTPQEDRELIESVHKNSKQRVITIVTNAGARGLNLQSPYMIRTPLWSAGQAVQMDARARRDPSKPLKVIKVVSTGAALYMNDTEEGKTRLAEVLDTGSDYDDIEKAVEALGMRIESRTLLKEIEKRNLGIDVG